MLEAGALHLEGADAVPGGDDHVVGPSDVPVVTVLILYGRVLGVEPLAAERLDACVLVAPVAERIVRVRARAQADLASLPLRDGPLVLVEDLDVPAGEGLAHRAFAHLEEGIVPDERVRLGEPVEVEDGEPVLRTEPADRFGIQRLPGRADAAEPLRIARPCVFDRHHRAHRRRCREHVCDLVPAEEVELLRRVEAGLP